MKVSGSADRPTQHTVARCDEALIIEIVRDEHYRQNTVYCSWQEILAGIERDEHYRQNTVYCS